MAVCGTCQGRASVRAPGSAYPRIDACRDCARREAGWIGESTMRRMEHAPAGEAGTVTMGTVRVGARLMLEVVVHAPVLRALPWYRGGMAVATVVQPHSGYRFDVERAGLEGPYRLLARGAGRQQKLPPVQLRVPALPDMEADERAAEPVPYELWPTRLMLTLPGWARPLPPSPNPLPEGDGVLTRQGNGGGYLAKARAATGPAPSRSRRSRPRCRPATGCRRAGGSPASAPPARPGPALRHPAWMGGTP